MRKAIITMAAVFVFMGAITLALTADIHGDRDPIGRINQATASYVR